MAKTIMESLKKLGRVGLIARFKPLHNGGARMLEAICKNSVEVIIGLGSANKYNIRNPFTVEESHAMVDAFLSQRFSNYSRIVVSNILLPLLF